ncbi:MAG: N-formylglutamate amidohydrolase [Sphingomonas sp.]|nr:N-formylglutamate amidohydrolase [Sphingomonas sp.]
MRDFGTISGGDTGADSAASFDRLGARAPLSPVVVSVPHGGRDYPAAMISAIRAPVAALRALEDRHIDTLARAAHRDEAMVIQRIPRAWIDLNRSEQERDPLLDDGANPKHQGAPSLKLRSGLGLVPRRVGAVDEIWRGRLRAKDVAARIMRDYRPYHATVAAALRAARTRFGCAVLVDLHSMPPLGPPGEAAQIVFGDRFGRSAAARFVARIEVEATAAGIAHALNTPYAGGHILDAHGLPARGLHAVQIEIDRRLYLDEALDQPGAGLPATAALLRRMFAALADEALAGQSAIAAE